MCGSFAHTSHHSSCAPHRDPNDRHTQLHKRSCQSGRGAIYCSGELSEGSWHLKCGGGNGVTQLKWILDLNKVPPECILLEVFKVEPMERKPLGWIQNSLEGPVHVRGLQRRAWEGCRGETWLKYPATPVAAANGMQMRWMKEMVDGWKAGQMLILKKVAVTAMQFNVNSSFLCEFGTRNILILMQFMGICAQWNSFINTKKTRKVQIHWSNPAKIGLRTKARRLRDKIKFNHRLQMALCLG